MAISLGIYPIFRQTQMKMSDESPLLNPFWRIRHVKTLYWIALVKLSTNKFNLADSGKTSGSFSFLPPEIKDLPIHDIHQKKAAIICHHLPSSAIPVGPSCQFLCFAKDTLQWIQDRGRWMAKITQQQPQGCPADIHPVPLGRLRNTERTEMVIQCDTMWYTINRY